jgi:hypothetical protein
MAEQKSARLLFVLIDKLLQRLAQPGQFFGSLNKPPLPLQA